MDNLRKQTALNIAIKSILICSAISHSAFAQEQKSNEANTSVLPTITVKADAQDEKLREAEVLKQNLQEAHQN